MKTCSKCKEIKPFSEFFKAKGNKDGLACWCKSCGNAYHKAYRQSERGKAVHAKYRKSSYGKASHCKSSAKYQQTHDGKICHRKGNAKYRRSQNGKAVIVKYQRSQDGKAVHHKANAKYLQTNKGKVSNRKGNAKYMLTTKGKAARKSFIARHPNQIKARNAVNNGIRDGRLPRATTQLCHYCPDPAQEYHHWHGYEPEYWLDVVPACEECHRKEHRKVA